jgi:uncharacterized protein (TIGR03067 family)
MQPVRIVLTMWITSPPPGTEANCDLRRREFDRHQGTWRVTSFISDGVESPPGVARSIVRVVEGDHVVWKRDVKSFAGTTVELDPTCEPKAIDVIPDGGRSRAKRVLGIHWLDGDDQTVCMAGPDQDRPKAFDAGKGSGRTLMTFRRERRRPSVRSPLPVELLLPDLSPSVNGFRISREQLIEILGKFHIEARGLVPDIPGGKPNRDAPPDVLPTGVVDHFGDVSGCLGHEPHCVLEGGELIRLL